jgi:ribosomal protein S18 acetylase RimI-like enzyme
MPRCPGVHVSGEPEIRLLNPDDAREWWRLRRESLQNDPEAFGSSVEDHQSLKAEDVRQRLSSNPTEFFIVGAFDGQSSDHHRSDDHSSGDQRLVGMSGFFREPGAKSRHKASVWGVYVTPAWRGQGVGRRLLESLLERAAGMAGLEQVLISVTATQMAASALYRALGFEPFGREPRALKVGERYIDEDHMLLRLKGRASNS